LHRLKIENLGRRHDVLLSSTDQAPQWALLQAL
jgi:hypothetical protein